MQAIFNFNKVMWTESAISKKKSGVDGIQISSYSTQLLLDYFSSATEQVPDIRMLAALQKKQKKTSQVRTIIFKVPWWSI